MDISFKPRIVRQDSLPTLPTPEPDSPSLLRPRRPYAFSTLCATVENPNESHKDQHGSSSVPIYQTATFKGVSGAYDYTRSGNPTRTHLGEQTRILAGGAMRETRAPAITYVQITNWGMLRASHRGGFVSFPCIYRVLRYGCVGYHYPYPQARERSYRR